MKRCLLPVVVVVVAFSGVSALAECWNKWCKGGCDSEGCDYIKVLIKQYPSVTAERKTPKGSKFVEEFDCELSKVRFISSGGGDWSDVSPGTIGKVNMQVACGK